MIYPKRYFKTFSKKTVALFLSLCLLLSSAGCASNSSTSSEVKSNSQSSTAASQVNSSASSDTSSTQQTPVEKKLFDVSITIPAPFFKGQDIESIMNEAKNDGVGEVTKNENGSVTYKMSKDTHKKMIDKIKKSLISSLDDMKNDKDTQSIKDITYNENFSQMTMIVDKEEYENSLDAFAALDLYLASAYYQIFNGIKATEAKTTFTIQDQSTNQVICTMVYPDEIKVYPDSLKTN